MSMCVGIDVGGTFTDAVLTQGSKVWRAKFPTVVSDLASSVLGALTLVAGRAGLDLDELLPALDRFGLGTTAVTNVLTARTGVAVGLITTAGFEDSLPLAKGRRINDGVWFDLPRAGGAPGAHRRRGRAHRSRRPRCWSPSTSPRSVEAARQLVDGAGVAIAGRLVSVVVPQPGARAAGRGRAPRGFPRRSRGGRGRPPADHPRIRADGLRRAQRLRPSPPCPASKTSRSACASSG